MDRRGKPRLPNAVPGPRPRACVHTHSPCEVTACPQAAADAEQRCFLQVRPSGTLSSLPPPGCGATREEGLRGLFRSVRHSPAAGQQGGEPVPPPAGHMQCIFSHPESHFVSKQLQLIFRTTCKTFSLTLWEGAQRWDCVCGTDCRGPQLLGPAEVSPGLRVQGMGGWETLTPKPGRGFRRRWGRPGEGASPSHSPRSDRLAAPRWGTADRTLAPPPAPGAWV